MRNYSSWNRTQPLAAEQAWDPTGAGPIPQEDRVAAACAHGATLVAMVATAGWLSFVGPLIMWVLYKDRSPYVRRAAAGAFNFNIWVNIISVVGWLLIISVIGIFPGAILLGVSGIMQVWCHLRATLRSLNGKDYRYPFQTRILS